MTHDDPCIECVLVRVAHHPCLVAQSAVSAALTVNTRTTQTAHVYVYTTKETTYRYVPV
jgi:hypothetical protein